MKLYADLPARRTRQIIADVLVLLWVVIWVRTGFAVRDTVLGALGPARSLEAAGDSLQGSLADVAARVEGILSALGPEQLSGRGSEVKEDGAE